MAYVKEHPPSEVYHLTKKENLNSILEDGMIRRFGDMECWFCVDLQKMKAYMEQTVMCEGKHRLTRAHREKQLKMSCQALHNAPPNRT